MISKLKIIKTKTFTHLVNYEESENVKGLIFRRYRKATVIANGKPLTADDV